MSGIDTRLIVALGLMLDNAPYDFTITEGLRTKERQEQLVAEGKSKTMNSKHLVGKAFDIAILVSGKVTWDSKYYEEWARTFIKICGELNYSIVWGGNWKTFKDCPHFEIIN